MELLARLSQDPSRGAIFLDVDGVLAPIVPRPEDARVPDETRLELRRLQKKYPLVACVSGRAGDDARRVVGVPELTFVGNHGLEAEHDADLWAARLADFLATVSWERVENKRLTATLHYRDAADEAAAREQLDEIARQARAAGLVARYGRKVLEILPPLEANKGTAVLRLLQERHLERAFYAGDDTTDLDAFAALDELELAVKVAVMSAEGPRELRDRADIAVEGPAALVAVLRKL